MANHQLRKLRSRNQIMTQLFQNLIRNKITKIEEETVFTKLPTHEKYSLSDKEQLKKLTMRGESIIR